MDLPSPYGTGNGTQTAYTTDGKAWNDPTRPVPGNIAYGARLYDQWNPTVAFIPNSNGYEAMMIWQDAREGVFSQKNGL